MEQSTYKRLEQNLPCDRQGSFLNGSYPLRRLLFVTAIQTIVFYLYFFA